MKDIIFTVYLSNDQTNHTTNYKIQKKFIYENPENFNTTSTTTITGEILDIDIDRSEEPEFLVSQSGNKGFFSFKKLR